MNIQFANKTVPIGRVVAGSVVRYGSVRDVSEFQGFGHVVSFAYDVHRNIPKLRVLFCNNTMPESISCANLEFIE